MPDDYYVSQYSGEEIDERLTAAHNAVRYDAAQTLTDAQKTQARANIAAAPDGFGLGGIVANIQAGANLNDYILTGFFGNRDTSTIKTWVNVPPNWPANEAILEVYTLGSYLIQRLSSVSTRVSAQRSLIGNAWTEWEWVNPPMQLGIEYRTTEQYLGKPVYTQIINCGSMPDIGSEKTTSIAAFNVDIVTFISGWCTYYGSVIEPNIFGMALSSNTVNIRIENLNREVNSSAVMYVLVKYTKTTD